MTRKRRMFDIELPEGDDETFPAGNVAPARRGPMAAAITETAESSRDRARIEAQIRAENDALAIFNNISKRSGKRVDTSSNTLNASWTMVDCIHTGEIREQYL